MSKNKKNSKTKTNKNTKTAGRGPGAPQKSVKWPKGKFTLNEAYKMNPDVCKLTIRSRAKKELKKVGLEETNKAGRPSFTFEIRASTARKNTDSVPTVNTPAPGNANENQVATPETPVSVPVMETTVAPVQTEQIPVAVVATPEAAVVGGEPVAA